MSDLNLSHASHPCIHSLTPSQRIQDVYHEQIEMIHPVVMRIDPVGIFRNKFLSEMFDLPYLV